MQILELAAQGVRGFSASSRAELPGGYSVLVAPTKEPVALGGLLIALLFPDSRGGDRTFLAPGCELGNASLMFRGNDGSAYYLARELGGIGALHRANEGSGQWELLTDDTPEIAEFLRSNVGLPSKKHFEQAFTLTASQFPSRRPKSRSTTNVESAALKLPGLQSPAKAVDASGAKAKLLELTKELELSAEIDRWQFKLDGIVTEISEVETRLAQAAQVEEALKRAEAAYAAVPSPESLNLPKDIVDRAKRFSQLVAKRDEALGKLDSDRSEAGLHTDYVMPLKQDLRFWVAAAVGTALFAAGLFLRGPARYVSLLDIPAFGIAALLAVRYVDERQSAEAKNRKGERRAAREKKISDDFDAEAGWVKKAMAALKVESPNDLVEALGRKAQLAQNLEELRAQVSAVHADPDHAAAVAKQKSLQRERDAIEKKMAEKGGYIRDAGEVQRDIDRLKRSIEAQGGSPAASLPAPGSSIGAGTAIEDPLPLLLALAAELLMVDAAAAGNLIRDRAMQYFAALTDRRYGGLEIDRTGKVWVTSRGQRLSARDLPGKDLDLLYLSVRLGLVGQCASRGRMPLVIEDVSGLIEPAKLGALAAILKHLGAATQVLHVSSDPGVQTVADATATL